MLRNGSTFCFSLHPMAGLLEGLSGFVGGPGGGGLLIYHPPWIRNAVTPCDMCRKHTAAVSVGRFGQLLARVLACMRARADCLGDMFTWHGEWCQAWRTTGTPDGTIWVPIPHWFLWMRVPRGLGALYQVPPAPHKYGILTAGSSHNCRCAHYPTICCEPTVC